MQNHEPLGASIFQQRGRMPGKRLAFSLMEMLVVISLIVLLISLLLPSLGKAKENARTASCLSNTRQLAIAWDAYTTDSNGYIMEYTLQSSSRALWTQVLRPYIADDHSLLLCPSTSDLNASTGVGDGGINGVRFGTATTTWVEARPSYLAPEPFNRSSYTWNGNMFSLSSYNTAKERYTKRTNISLPERAPILGDGVWRSQTPGSAGSFKQFPLDLDDPRNGISPGSVDSVWAWVTNRHGKVTNVSFADTHAESVPLNNMWSLQWHRNYETVEFLD